jgi:hypothetical protein
MSVKGQDTKLEEVGIRVGGEGDVAYFFTRSLSDLRHCPAFQGCPDGLYHQYMHRALEHTLTRAITFVAYPLPKRIKMNGSKMVRSSNTSDILGYVVADPTQLGLVVHYANVRKTYNDHGTLTEDYRGLGIATKIIDAMFKEYEIPNDKIIYTLKTPMFRYQKAFKQKLEKEERFTYNPFLFWTLLPDNWETGIRKPSTRYMAQI